MTNFYHHQATSLVNQVADQAMDFINSHLREAPWRPIDMRQVCIWSVDAVAPLASRAEKSGLAHEASIVIQQALALDRLVDAKRHAA